MRKAGLLYGWVLRRLVLLAPAVVFICHPVACPIAALVVCAILVSFDKAELVVA